MASATTTPAQQPADLPPADKIVPALCLTAFLAAVVGAVVWAYLYITNLQSTATQETKFIFRRFEDPVRILGWEFDNPYWFWLPILGPTLVLALVYVVWMYIRDARSVGWLWATFLGAVRFTVYIILALVFLMPALQTWEKTESRSKVLLLVDLSGSMRLTDEIPDGSVPLEKLPTRMDKVRQLLTRDQAAFVKNLLEKNPVAVYAFGGRLDEDARLLQKGGEQWTAEDWAAWMNLDIKHWLLDELTADDKAALRSAVSFEGDPAQPPIEWATAWLKVPDEQAVPADKLSAEGKARVDAKRAKLLKKLDTRAQLLNGTNLGESLLAAYNREANNMLAGIIVISDGRSNQGSDQAFVELKARAHKARVPIFTIGVGENRERVNIQITSLQGPDQAPPDEKFPIRGDVDGQGLPDKPFEAILEIFKPKSDPKSDKPVKTVKVEGKFLPGETPHGQVEFIIDPNSEQFADIARKSDTPGARPELEEGEWTFVLKVPRHKQEIFPEPFHVSSPHVVRIVKKPLRVLLFAGGPSREYQFALRLFANAVEKKLAEMSVYLQVGLRPEEARVQDVDPQRLLKNFPTFYDTQAKEGENRFYNLAEYDLVIAFDPDWEALSDEQRELLRNWVQDQDGGLIVVGGAVNTFKLGVGLNFDKLKPILDLYPVALADNRLGALDLGRRPTTDPWPLKFDKATREDEFLKLDDDKPELLHGWNEFFKSGKGFYNYYPARSIKPGAKVVATFGDPRANMPDGSEQPFLVTQKVGKGIVVYISSGEMWRLRQFKEAYHERFWTKLARYASSGSRTKSTRRGVPIIGKEQQAGRYIPIEAQMFEPTGAPMSSNARPRVKIIPPAGVTLEKPDLVLVARPVADPKDWQGYFQGRIDPLRQPGTYEVEIQVPGSTELLKAKFQVREANLEMDNTRPDFGALYQIASDVKELRVDDRIKAEVKKRVATRPDDDKGKSPEEGKDRDSQRLFFQLKDTRAVEVIPECLTFDIKTQSNRGPVDDLWDDGETMSTTVAQYLTRYLPWGLALVGLLLAVLGVRWLLRDAPVMGTISVVGGLLLLPCAYGLHNLLVPLADQPVKIATLLWIVVGLLSIEWLTRKLLKLA